MAAALLALALIGAWEGVVRLGWVDELLLAAPTQVGQALWEDRALLSSDLWVTAVEVLLGLALATVLGLALAALMHVAAPVRRALGPLIIGSQAVPVPVIAPLLVLLLGFGLGPKLLLVALVCFFPVTINALDGLAGVDPEQRKLLRSLGAGRWRTLRLLEAPAALPAAFTGVRVAAAVAVIGAVFAEWAGASEGLGHLLLVATPALQTPRAFAAVVLLCALAVSLYAALTLLERHALPWAHRSRARSAA